MVFIALKVAKAFVDAVVLYMMDGFAEDVGHSLAHSGIKLHIRRKDGDTMPAYNILHLKNGIATVESEFLGFGGECDNTSVIVRENTDGLTLQTGMKHFFYRTEETIAIHQGIHISNVVYE